jgi:myo-inositol 2-dehydrogenase / D-chiro-inositol 1-dehydrogenase
MERREFLNKTLKTAAFGIAMPTIVPSSVFGKNAPSNKVNIGQIGCGRIARDHDLASTLKHDSARIMAACDVDRNRLEDGKKLIDGFTQKRRVTINIWTPKCMTITVKCC